MTTFDAVASDILLRYVIPIVSVLGLLYFIFAQMNRLKKGFFAFIYKILSPIINSSYSDWKQDLFKDLRDIKSLDRDLRNQGLLRILEIGAGPGNNFNFYPRNSKVLLVEPNANFIDDLKKNATKFNVQIEKIIIGKGENMSEVESNFVDVVVITLVFCSVTDVDSCIREAYRVLIPGGKLYFLEHGFGKRKTWQRRLQTIANPLWKFVFGGCNLTRDILHNIKKLDIFENVKSLNFVPSKLPILLRVFVGRHVIGTAHKPLNAANKQ